MYNHISVPVQKCFGDDFSKEPSDSSHVAYCCNTTTVLLHFCNSTDGDFCDDLSVADNALTSSLADLSIISRPSSSLSRVAPETWQSVSGKFLGKHYSYDNDNICVLCCLR